jgi:hypothetical protein
MTRHGKIARLPHALREELNTRLHDGEPGSALLPWLNGLPAVQAVLAAHFGGRPVSESNVSEWRLGGYADWLRLQEARAWLGSFREEAAALADGEAAPPLATALAAPLTIALGRCLQQVTSAPGDSAQLAALLELSRELTRLRRCTLAEQRGLVDHERWAAEKHKFLQIEEDKIARNKRLIAQALAVRAAQAAADPANPPPPLDIPPHLARYLPPGFMPASSATASATAQTPPPAPAPAPPAASASA